MTVNETAALFIPLIGFAILMGLGNIVVMMHENAVRRRI